MVSRIYLKFPSFNNDGVYCVMSGSGCKFSGHDMNIDSIEVTRKSYFM